MGRKRKPRRQAHGSTWHWKQTDCWYYTMPGTKQRMGLFDEQGQRIRGKENQDAAELALAREKLSWGGEANGSSRGGGEWIVARVCSEYLQYCERGLANDSISRSHHDNAVSWLNDLCAYCGALPVAQLKKGHVQAWIEEHTSWRSPATHRSVIAVVLAAFNRADEMYGISSPLKGLTKPASKPRLQSITPDDEQTLYKATEPCFGAFLFAAIHTGLRPFCELARLTADEVEETERGMMWRVDSSKTKKVRKIPVRPEVAELTRKLLKTAPKGRWFRSFPALVECLRIHGAKKLQNDKSTKWDVQVSKLVRFKDGRLASSAAKPLYRGVDGHKQRQNPEDPS